MINNVNIIAVDDELDELTAIQNAFFSGGISCLPIHFQYDVINNKSGIEHINVANFKPRVVVTDLNLMNGSLGKPMDLVTPIANLLKKLAIEGPYLLIFWSGVTDQVAEVMELLQNRFGSELTLPLHHSSIDKNQYLQADDPNILKDKVCELINESALLNALLDWEVRVSKAAKATINELFKLTKPEPTQNYQEQHKSKLEETLALIGNESIGEKNAKIEPELAIDSGLAPVLQDQLNSLSTRPKLWSAASPALGNNIKVNDSKLKIALNSFCHIEEVSKDYPINCRGVFVSISPKILLNETAKKTLESNLGLDIDKIIKEEFLNFKVKDKNLEEVTFETTLGFIEISAECDQAQQKTTLHKYVLAALTPLKYEDYDLYDKSRSAHGAIYRIPDISYQGKDYMLQVSFRYQIGSLPSRNKWFGEPLLRLKDQVMSDLTFNFAHNISRPGIIHFR
jgi:hypothetical protein